MGRPLCFTAVVSSFFLLFVTFSQRSQVGCLPYFPRMMCLSANLQCRSEMCCTQLAENTGCKNSPKICHLHTIVQLYRAISSQLRHVSTIRKKLVKEQYNISSTCPYNMVNFRPLTAEIVWRVWSTTVNFNGFCVLASLLHRHRSTEVNQTLHDVWPSPGLVHYIYILGALAPDRILPGAIFTLCPSLVFKTCFFILPECPAFTAVRDYRPH